LKNAADVPHAQWLSSVWQEDAEETLHIVKDNAARWIVVDHYGLDAQWEKHVAGHGRKVLAIDDLADRNHVCDILLDQNLHSAPYERYAARITPQTQLLIGQRFGLLRPEFTRGANLHRIFRSESITYFVAFSGADTAQLTGLTLKALSHVCQSDEHVHVVASSQNAELIELTELCNARGWQLHVDSSSLAELMSSSDIGIGAGGGMLWERAAMGLPSIAIAIADNQREQVAQSHALGLVLGCDVDALTPDMLQQMILRARTDLALRQNMSAICRATVDGRGAARVARRLVASDISLRRANFDDSANLFAWRNDERIRRVSLNAGIITQADHERWLKAALANVTRHLLIAADDEGSLGAVRFDLNGLSAEVSIYLVPQRFGSGQGAGLLLAAESWLSKNCPDNVEILATVLTGNIASEELFRSCGYRLTNGVFVKRMGTAA
jgi:UDP-2,4-diacetamido-2,4,6-trideoxy-beta-L-altropyranose hydrolase